MTGVKGEQQLLRLLDVRRVEVAITPSDLSALPLLRHRQLPGSESRSHHGRQSICIATFTNNMGIVAIFMFGHLEYDLPLNPLHLKGAGFPIDG